MSLRWLVCLACLLLLPTWASAHHILGIPHYAYDEDYPQTPILTYVAELGPYEMRMTGYPGVPRPGERSTLHVYLRGLEGGAPFEGTVTAEVFRKVMFGTDRTIYGPVAARLEDKVFKFVPQFEEEANYLVRLSYEAEGVPWIVDLPMVVGEPGSPWKVLGGLAIGLVVFLVFVRAMRIKLKRRRSSSGAVLRSMDGMAPE